MVTINIGKTGRGNEVAIEMYVGEKKITAYVEHHEEILLVEGDTMTVAPDLEAAWEWLNDNN